MVPYQKVLLLPMILGVLSVPVYANGVEIFELDTAEHTWSGVLVIQEEEFFIDVDSADAVIYIESVGGQSVQITSNGVIGDAALMDIVCDVLFNLCQKLYFFIDKIVCLIGAHLGCIP